MKLSEKIIELRKVNGMTQEELAAICNVSRQSISKWEADIALPETEKLLILGETFHVPIDVLLKDSLILNEVKEVHGCSDNAIQAKKQEIYEGILIKESITDDTVIDLIKALFIPTAAIDTDAIAVLPKCMNDLLKYGIQNKNIKVYDLHIGMELDELQQFDVVYLCGGNRR